MGENKCGECTVCCTLSVVEELDKKAFETCNHCILKKGCGIYNKRPKVCKDFECAYLQGGKNIEQRPDKCGVMFFKINNNIFAGVLVPGVDYTDVAKTQIAVFREQGYSVILFKEKTKPFIALAEGHNKEEIYLEYLKEIKIGNI